MGKNGYDKHIDQEWYEQGKARLNEEVHIGFSYFVCVSSLHIAGLSNE